MPRLQRKSFAAADEVRTFSRGHIDVVLLDEIAMARFMLQPGWRWSIDVAPTVRTHSCQNRHVGYAISGSLQVVGRRHRAHHRGGRLLRDSARA